MRDCLFLPADTPPGLSADSLLYWQAVDGQGRSLRLAECASVLGTRELADGRLVCPLAASASSDKAYYLIIPERRREAPALQRLREWLLAEAAAYRQAQANAELSA